MRPTPHAVFTTGQVAHICSVAPGTVVKWFDSGRLTGFRVPGSRERRIMRESLVAFMERHGMPMDRVPPVNGRKD
jgi:two-component system, OmpR family, response regulator RpaA